MRSTTLFPHAVCLVVGCLLASHVNGADLLARWTSTATDGMVAAPAHRGVPVTLTWSIAPDATLLPGNPSGSVPSNLVNFLDANWGAGPGGSDLTQRPWYGMVADCFDRLGQLSGVTFVYEPADDGGAFNSTQAGVLGVRGDIRLGGKSFGAGSPTLALTYLPTYGELMVNTDQVTHYVNVFNDYRRLRNTIMHEALHALGLGHVDSNDARFLAEPIITTAFDGPQLDDILGLQRLYGDRFEKDGGNDSPLTAVTLGSITPNQPASIGAAGSGTVVDRSEIDFVSIDDEGDADFYRFTLLEPLTVTLNLAPQGATYLIAPSGQSQQAFNSAARSDLALTVFADDGSTMLATADAAGAGFGEQISLPLAAGQYYARVIGVHDDVQLYELSIDATAAHAAADFNGDDAVDALDLAIWQNGFGIAAAAGDADEDGWVDGADFLMWQRQFSPLNAAIERAEPAPEPAALILALSCWMGLQGAVRRRFAAVMPAQL